MYRESERDEPKLQNWWAMNKWRILKWAGLLSLMTSLGYLADYIARIAATRSTRTGPCTDSAEVIDKTNTSVSCHPTAVLMTAEAKDGVLVTCRCPR